MEARIKPVSKLAKNITSKEIIEKCNELLDSIQDEIKSALESCATNITYELPTSFSIAHYTSQRAQRHIYYHILKALSDSAYIATIEFKGQASESQRVILKISWMTPDQLNREKKMDEFIKSKIVSQKTSPQRSLQNSSQSSQNAFTEYVNAYEKRKREGMFY